MFWGFFFLKNQQIPKSLNGTGKSAREHIHLHLLEKLQTSFDHFEITLDSQELQSLISQFVEGHPFDAKDPDSHLIHSIQISPYMTIEGRRKSTLSLEQISSKWVVVDFWFFGSKWDAPEWNQVGIKAFQIAGFQKFLLTFTTTFGFLLEWLMLKKMSKKFFTQHVEIQLRSIN